MSKTERVEDEVGIIVLPVLELFRCLTDDENTLHYRWLAGDPSNVDEEVQLLEQLSEYLAGEAQTRRHEAEVNRIASDARAAARDVYDQERNQK